MARFSGKRELLARGLFWTGASQIINQLPQRNQLIVLNYHRIGNAVEEPFDPGVYSATADELDHQMRYLSRHFSVITLNEALDIITGVQTLSNSRTRVLITFDDGYLDNYTIAFPILRSHGISGVFFLATSLVGSAHVPWWDEIAYLVKNGRRRRFTLSTRTRLEVDLDADGVEKSLMKILRLYASQDNTAPAEFIRNLREATESPVVPETERRFLDWEEAQEMIRGGMAIGSHTHSHTVLSQLSLGEQSEEMLCSSAHLREHLGFAVSCIAYPVGTPAAFSSETQRLAREAGYRAAFSYYGGTNVPGNIQPFNVKRIGIGGSSTTRFKVQAAICRATGRYWP